MWHTGYHVSAGGFPLEHGIIERGIQISLKSWGWNSGMLMFIVNTRNLFQRWAYYKPSLKKVKMQGLPTDHVVTCWERADLLALVCGVFCEYVTFPLVSWVRCGTWLYRFLIFAPLLTSIKILKRDKPYALWLLV